MKKYKFIGGPIDGQTLKLDDATSVVEIPIFPESLTAQKILSEEPKEVGFSEITQKAIYKKETLHFVESNVETDVFCTVDVKNDHIIERLVEGYTGVNNDDS